MSLNIVSLIEENPNIKLSKNYQDKLINKIKDNFSTEEQQIFISSFYCYLNYNLNDFVIDLDTIWKWIGFSQKVKAKELLEKYFKLDIDYKTDLSLVENSKGGRPSDKYLINIKTFKKMCLKANTSKANEIHDYYIKLEEILYEIISEQNNELKFQLKMKDEEIQKRDEILNKLQRQTRNVCYLFTTNEKEIYGIYMVGKTSNLQNITNLKIIYYISCKSEHLMEPIEIMILSKMNKYKIGQNVFQLPKGKDVSFFTQYFDKLKIFCDDIEEDLVLEKRIEAEPQENENFEKENCNKKNTCVCGMTIYKGHMKRHEESKIHKSYIASQTPVEIK